MAAPEKDRSRMASSRWIGYSHDVVFSALTARISQHSGCYSCSFLTFIPRIPRPMAAPSLFFAANNSDASQPGGRRLALTPR